MPDGPETTLSPDQAVDRLEVLHAKAVQAQRDALASFAAGGPPPDAIERRRFRYPELRPVWESSGPVPVTRRAWGKFQTPGTYATTITEPGFFRRYLLEQPSCKATGTSASAGTGTSGTREKDYYRF